MDSATWCRTPAAASAASRLRPEVSKNCSTALSSNEGELARSITTCVPAMACLSPLPVTVLTPVFGEAATTSWPRCRRMATVFEPIRPVPPMTTIFMVYPPLVDDAKAERGHSKNNSRVRRNRESCWAIQRLNPRDSSVGLRKKIYYKDWSTWPDRHLLARLAAHGTAKCSALSPRCALRARHRGAGTRVL